jgi:hypothetical protein
MEINNHAKAQFNRVHAKLQFGDVLFTGLGSGETWQ